jgi:hypothetical protein
LLESLSSSYALLFLFQEVKELTAEDFLVFSDLSEESTEEDSSFSELKHVADQPTVAAAVHNLINPEVWTPNIATGPRQPVPP